MENKIVMEIDSKIDNVSVVRVAIATFISNLNIMLDDLMDIKTAVSEAVTNSIEHGYLSNEGKVIIECLVQSYEVDKVTIVIKDFGVGIEDIELATTPTYTSKPELEHAGLGFTIMESFMDTIQIDSSINSGTVITLTKILNKKKS